mmetsp:Transcript_23632/g.29058  ORF Transcript_23632/g.29058 Transcript_23632/m.29058 type:complete len:80 (+) Transcript_23632:877-1116(+)
MNLESLEEYCSTIGVKVVVVPLGSNIKPPPERTFNLGMNPDLEKEMELLDYLFSISESELEEDTEEMKDGKEDIEGAWE